MPRAFLERVLGWTQRQVQVTWFDDLAVAPVTVWRSITMRNAVSRMTRRCDVTTRAEANFDDLGHLETLEFSYMTENQLVN